MFDFRSLSSFSCFAWSSAIVNSEGLPHAVVRMFRSTMSCDRTMRIRFVLNLSSVFFGPAPHCSIAFYSFKDNQPVVILLTAVLEYLSKAQNEKGRRRIWNKIHNGYRKRWSENVKPCTSLMAKQITHATWLDQCPKNFRFQHMQHEAWEKQDINTSVTSVW